MHKKIFSHLAFITVTAFTLLLVVIATLFNNTPQVHADNNCTVSSDLINSCRPWFGAAARGNPGTPTNKLTTAQTNDRIFQFTYLESLIGHSLDIIRVFDNCSQSGSSITCSDGSLPFASGSSEQVFTDRQNTYADMNWKPATNWADAGGGNTVVNNEIVQVAQNIKALAPNKVFLTIWHEPQNDVSAFDNATQQAGCSSDPNFKGLVGGAGTPSQYIAMWQNVQNIFAQQGVDNVVWAANYQGTATGQWDCLLQPLWPGNSLVNWVGYDTYSGSSLKTWDQSVGRMYTVLQNQTNSTTNFASKPWGVFEFGDCNSNDAAQISQYFSDATTSFNANAYPNLKMYMVYASTGNGAGSGCLTDYDANGTYDSTKQTEFNQFANAVFNYQPSITPTITPTPTVSPSPSPTPTPTPTPDINPPSVPLNLIASPNGAHEIDVSWNASTDDVGVAGYDVFRNGNQVGTVTNSTTYQDIGLTDGITNSYAVSAFDAAGNVSAQSATVSATTPDVTPPSIPTNLQTSLNSSAITVSWAASTDNVGVTGYLVYRNGTQIATVTSGISYTDSGLSDATTYQYTVSAFDAAGNTSSQSSVVSVTTPDTTPPSVPTGLTVTATAPHQISLSWQPSNDNVGVTAYNIYRNNIEVATVIGPAATTFTDIGLADATKYSYTVTAVDAAGNESAKSSVVNAMTPDGTAPSVPANLSLSLTATSITSSWSASTDNVGVAGYTIYRNGIKFATATQLSYADTSVVQGKTYQYTVAAFDASGNVSSQSASKSLTFPDKTPPTAPTNLKATAGTKSVSLSWTASTDNVGVASYSILRNGVFDVTVSGTTTNYLDKGLSTGKTYSYNVFATDAAGNKSPASNTASAKAK